jgi:hypothetical protein
LVIVIAMLGPALLFFAAISADSGPVEPARTQGADFRPNSAVTTRTRASVRILTGVAFGQSHRIDAPEASLREARITTQDGTLHPAELLEFQ